MHLGTGPVANDLQQCRTLPEKASLEENIDTKNYVTENSNKKIST